jgi:hypothetical protein
MSFAAVICCSWHGQLLHRDLMHRSPRLPRLPAEQVLLPGLPVGIHQGPPAALNKKALAAPRTHPSMQIWKLAE